MSKPAKPAATGDQPPKSKKMLIIIIAVVVLVVGGGAGAYFFMNKSDHSAKKEHAAEAEDAASADEGDGGEEDSGGHEKTPPKFVELGTFTGKLVDANAERYLQATISVKLSKPELEEKVKEYNPEILHKINMVLQSKRSAELETTVGKEKLAAEIKVQVEYVLGLRKSAPPIRTSPEPDANAESGQDAHSAPEHKEESRSKKGVEAILFTTFIIQ
ncbi:MAG: flagellar basal body-associated FliL family protein [Gallionella sp.]|nr:flagellar basal body-associated FliL family protein [Gallionella sp.]MDD4945715.1 flagellar basal body-associated FliL family protein [Gallionella sp.]MDD5612678.1 flagellar basal body-associated FliL family protein [Gallionella sp.]